MIGRQSCPKNIPQFLRLRAALFPAKLPRDALVSNPSSVSGRSSRRASTCLRACSLRLTSCCTSAILAPPRYGSGVIWLLPLLGPVLYLVLGVNRIRRRAVSLGVHGTFRRPVPDNLGEPEHAGAEHLQHLARIVSRLVAQPLAAGNAIEPLVNGDEAFPAMLAAIESAKKSVSLCTYIFDNDASGEKFVAALERAVRRGVQVRVLIDAAGARYSWPPITCRLRQARIPCARFLPASLFTPWRVATINLRNHRKSLIVDGQIAFTGGMNIRHGNMISEKPRRPVQDLHFRVTGPVVAQLQEAFANDWAFTTREVLDGEIWFPKLSEAGRGCRPRHHGRAGRRF